MDLIECLIKAGFTRHESILYTTLCKEGELTGYEAAKISAIPRSNAYLALAGLVEKGGAYVIEGDSVKYVAVPASELVINIKRQMNEVLDYIEKNTPEREAPKDSFITITGRSQILDKMKNLILQAEERIYLSISRAELEYVIEELREARDRGLKLVIITSSSFDMKGATIYCHQKQPGQVRLITDTSHVLTGEIMDEGNSTCLYSKNKNLVHLIKDSLTNEIKIIQMQS
ncbi:MAG: TrmB family transcriptional regulator [Clostridia bacterium]|nr:TrmB family transcriptional regulator [Clostridia bacterium]